MNNNINISKLNPQELEKFRNSVNYESLGFDNVEYEYNDDLFKLDDSFNKKLTNSNSLNIQKNLTTVNYSNGSIYDKRFIVIHYTANDGDTAWGNTNYFKSTYRSASAHYFVDENSIWQCVEDKNISWHCGGGLQGSGGHSFYKVCTNRNSIGIELCSRKYSNGKYYFKPETIINAELLVNYLINKYGISDSHIIRHYDVTGKICPEPFVRDINAWNDFKYNAINNNINVHWAKQYLDYFVSKGFIQNKEEWSELDAPVTNAKAVAFIDKLSGGTWYSDEANSSIHWAQPNVISLCGKHIITDPDQWIPILDSSISKAMLLALVDKMTDGTLDKYKNRKDVDHWARNNLDSLCDKRIISTPSSWIDFEAEFRKGETMALLYKAINR